MKKTMKLLVATDFSKDSKKALDEAVQLARGRDAVIYLMHSVDTIQDCAADYCLSNEVVEAARNKLIGEAREKLDEEIRRVGRKRNIAIVPDVRYGHPYDEITREEMERDVDILLVGEHGRKSLWQRWRSHLAEKLVQNPVRDILVIPPSA